MKCYNCGFENSDSANYCSNCGMPLKIHLSPERRIVVVMFADLVNFTKISENKDPEDVLNMINALFDKIEKIVVKYDGTIDKYLGDGVMILFGTPVAHEDDVERALRCAEEIIVEKDKIKGFLNEEIKIKISINVGPVICGYTGGTHRRMYTVIGDVVNVAEKINDLAEPDSIIVTKEVVEYVSPFFNFEELGEFVIPGREEKIRLFKFTGSKGKEPALVSIKGKLVPLVGRRDELNAIINSLHKATSGNGRVLVLVGEAGVGKSRMKFEVKNYIRERELDIKIVETYCKSQARNALYQPIIELINLLQGYGAQFDGLHRAVERVGSELVGSLKEKFDFSEILINLIKQIASKTPLFLVVEDIHWIDEASLEVLKNLIENITSLPVFVLLTHRPSPKVVLPDLPQIETITLANLTKQESLRLVQELVDADTIPPEFIDIIYKKTEGNPLFIEELVELLYKERVFVVANRRLLLNKRLEEVHIPDRITNLFIQEIDKLPSETKYVVKVASVIGRDFNKKILGAVLSEYDIERHLAVLEESGLVFKDRQSEDRFIFKHSFIRDAAYSLLPRKEQKELHLKIAEAIERLYSSNLKEHYDTLSYHYEVGENFLKAFHYNLASGLNYLTLNLLGPARNKFRKSEEILLKMTVVEKDSLDKKELLELYLNFAVVSRKMGLFSEAKNKGELAKRFSLELGDRDALTKTFSLITEICLESGDFDGLAENLSELEKYLQEPYFTLFVEEYKLMMQEPKIDEDAINHTLKLLNNLPDSYHHGVVFFKNLLPIWNLPKNKDFVLLLSSLFNSLRATNEIDIHILNATQMLCTGDKKTVWMELERVKDLLSTNPDEEKHFEILVLESILKREQGDFTEAQQTLSLARSIADEIPNYFLKSVALYLMGLNSLSYLNEYRFSLTHFTTAFETLQNIGEKRVAERSKLFIWFVNLVLGNPILYENLPQHLRTASERMDLELVYSIQIMKTVTGILVGDINKALEELKHIELAFSYSAFLVGLAEVLLLILMIEELSGLPFVIEKILFVLNERADFLYEHAQHNALSALYYGIIEGDWKRAQKFIQSGLKDERVGLIREASLLLQAANILTDNNLDPWEKLAMMDDLYVQAEIMHSLFLCSILKMIKYNLNLKNGLVREEDLKGEVLKIFTEYKAQNLIKLMSG